MAKNQRPKANSQEPRTNGKINMSDHNNKIKVVWLCHFSNAFVHEKLDLHHNRLIGLLKRLLHKPVSTDVPEFANWITNGIKEFEKIDDVELHIVSPYPNLKNRIQEYSDKGIHYHFFQNEDELITTCIYKRLFNPAFYRYKKNCRTISNILTQIDPDVVHLFGAENPYYALGILKVPQKSITIAQLQTLMNDPDFKNNYPIDERTYKYRAQVEKIIIHNVDCIGTTAKKFRIIISDNLRPDAIILNTGLALRDEIKAENYEKTFDFVYFAANLSKAADLALEAFGIAYKKRPSISLDVIGGYGSEFKQLIDKIIEQYGIKDAVTFEGKLPTHEDVLKQIRKSRFALLPLKIDLTSGTIREAMSNGLPVITTNTGELGTQKLNNLRQNVLISEIGDHQALAENILRLMDDIALADTLRQNAFQTCLEAKSNAEIARKYVEAYKACMEHFRDNKPLPTELLEV